MICISTEHATHHPYFYLGISELRFVKNQSNHINQHNTVQHSQPVSVTATVSKAEIEISSVITISVQCAAGRRAKFAVHEVE